VLSDSCGLHSTCRGFVCPTRVFIAGGGFGFDLEMATGTGSRSPPVLAESSVLAAGPSSELVFCVEWQLLF